MWGSYYPLACGPRGTMPYITRSLNALRTRMYSALVSWFRFCAYRYWASNNLARHVSWMFHVASSGKLISIPNDNPAVAVLSDR